MYNICIIFLPITKTVFKQENNFFVDYVFHETLIFILQGMSQYQLPRWDLYGPTPYFPSVVVPKLVEGPKVQPIGEVADFVENKECFKVHHPVHYILLHINEIWCFLSSCIKVNRGFIFTM